MANEKPTVAVLGPGGVGGLLAGLLARAGHRVICLASDETAHTLRTAGLRVRTRDFSAADLGGADGGGEAFSEFTVAVEADGVLREPVDFCLVAVKETGLDGALDRVPPAALGDALLVPFLNGVEHPAALRARYRADLVAPAAIRVESARVAPGVIERGSPFTEIDLTLGDGTVDRERVHVLARALDSAGVSRVRVYDEETAPLWAKLRFLAPFALLTTRYALPLGEVRTRHRDELRTLLEEAAAVGHAAGTPTGPAPDAALINRELARYDAFPAPAKSSMQRDAEAGRPLELDAIGGSLLRAAERHGVSVPVTARVVRELRAAGH
ncbi:2-dehydropantoate 2-reductase [Streptomyces sp. NPDC005648]|uniref:ketopantoate reductase family protein n=1 Tax=Streptomyces sp. NPDC005648 TaxID=3157044 RepID=UPI00339DE079